VKNEATYEIFRKEADNSTVLIEAVKGIDDAQKRVNELNRDGSSEYFIFDAVNAYVIEPMEPSVAIDPLAP
jgi:hypothetical protein